MSHLGLIDGDAPAGHAARLMCLTDGIDLDDLRRWAGMLDRAYDRHARHAEEVDVDTNDDATRSRMVLIPPPLEGGTTTNDDPAYWAAVATWGVHAEALEEFAARKDHRWLLGKELITTYERVREHRQRARKAHAAREKRRAEKAGTWSKPTLSERIDAQSAAAKRSLAELQEWYAFALPASATGGGMAEGDVRIYFEKMRSAYSNRARGL
jgi:hypothetical protein